MGIGLRWRRSEEATQGCSRELPGAEPILKGLPSRVSLVANELVGGSPSHLDLCVCVCVCVCVCISGLSILFHRSVFLFLCHYHTILITVAL